MRGVWLSQCAKPPLLVMDIELSDAKEVSSAYQFFYLFNLVNSQTIPLFVNRQFFLCNSIS